MFLLPDSLRKVEAAGPASLSIGTHESVRQSAVRLKGRERNGLPARILLPAVV